jgi:hypothetical protein
MILPSTYSHNIHELGACQIGAHDILIIEGYDLLLHVCELVRINAVMHCLTSKAGSNSASSFAPCLKLKFHCRFDRSQPSVPILREYTLVHSFTVIIISVKSPSLHLRPPDLLFPILLLTLFSTFYIIVDSYLFIILL